MENLKFTSGLEAIDALQKFWEASDSFKHRNFTDRYNEMVGELDKRQTDLAILTTSSKCREEDKEKYKREIKEIQHTFTQLKNLADAVYDQHHKYPGKLPKPIENSLLVYFHSIWRNGKKELLPFIYGFRLGYIFSLKYGDVWKDKSNT